MGGERMGDERDEDHDAEPLRHDGGKARARAFAGR